MVRRWMLLPSWVRVLGGSVFWAAFTPAAMWQFSYHRVLVTVGGALVLAAVGGAVMILEERKTRRLPAILGWTGDSATFARVRADVDAGTLPADPQLHEVARACASHRLGNAKEGKVSPWFAFLNPVIFFGLSVSNLHTNLFIGYATLGVVSLLTAAAGCRRQRLLPPRWRRVLDNRAAATSTALRFGPFASARHF